MIVIPDVHSPGYRESIKAEIDRLAYVAVLPTSDTTLIALDDPGASFVDKESLFERAEAAGLGFPPSEVFASGLALVEAAGRFDYPVIVKPAVGKPPRRADGPEDVAWWRPKTARLIVQPFLTEPIRTVNGVMWEGRLAAVAHQRYLRVWPPDAGMALAAETIEPDEGLEERVVSFLEGYSGIFELELCGPYLLDVNARVYGSVMLAVKAGANLPAIYCDLLRGRPLGLVRARPGRVLPVARGRHPVRDRRRPVRTPLDSRGRSHAAASAGRGARGSGVPHRSRPDVRQTEIRAPDRGMGGEVHPRP